MGKVKVKEAVCLKLNRGIKKMQWQNLPNYLNNSGVI